MSAINDVENDKQEKKEKLVENKEEDAKEVSSIKIKLLYVEIISFVLLIVISVALIVIWKWGKNKENKNNSNEGKEQKEEENEEEDIYDYIYMNETHYITATYSVMNAQNEWEDGGDRVIQLFNEKYLNSISSLLINYEKVKVSNKYFFKVGFHTVTIEFNRTLKSTDVMFKDCTELRTIDFS